MRVIMLGWEYPPHIGGGLGTACEGLTKALAKNGAKIDFIVPRLYGDENAPHMNIEEPRLTKILREDQMSKFSENWHENLWLQDDMIDRLRIPTYLLPYVNKLNTPVEYLEKITEWQKDVEEESLKFFTSWWKEELDRRAQGSSHYSSDLFQEVTRFSAKILHAYRGREADIIHAHDWMTYPAGVALKQTLGLPLVVHVHSLEQDRSGGPGNSIIADVEKMGLYAADHIIAVSYYTRKLINELYGVPLEKISVVHNGVYTNETVQRYREEDEENKLPKDIVLFLGRVTIQKGPDYFVEAAAKVIPHIPDVLFVMAGQGDLLPRMKHRVSELGIQKNFMFTGFLHGKEVEKMFSMASLYVMPSVSEPFGIAALEAINYETPVIISKQSGVSEVLTHALKVDFWDVDELANKIISAIKYEDLRKDMVQFAKEEVRRLHWNAAAEKTQQVYQQALQGGF